MLCHDGFEGGQVPVMPHGAEMRRPPEIRADLVEAVGVLDMATQELADPVERGERIPRLDSRAHRLRKAGDVHQLTLSPAERP
nr:hypothetical protein GCM10020092_096450 [Actinoplanes digitatis]